MQDLLPPAIWLLELLVVAQTLVAVGVVFRHAGLPPWSVLVPVYNAVAWTRAAGTRPLVLLVFLVPGLNLFLPFGINIQLARRFERGAPFGFGLTLLPFLFWPLLALSLHRQQGTA